MFNQTRPEFPTLNIHKILRTARLVSWIYRLLSTAVGLVTVRLINDGIGLSGYGDLAFLLAFVTGVGAIDLGFLQSLSRFVSRHQADCKETRGVFWASCLLFVLGLFVLQTLLVVAMVIALDAWNQLRSLPALEVLTIGIIFVAGNLMTASSAVLAGWQRYGASGAAKIGRSLAYLAAVIALWATDTLTIGNILWANALAALVPNLLVTLWLLLMHRHETAWSRIGFQESHRSQLLSIADYSLRGWLFTASTIVVGSGAVFVAALILEAASVAKLQIGLVLYTGVAAFVTGSMVPLTTICSRLADGSAASQAKVAATARSLTEEAIVMVAILLGFFVHYIDMVLGLLIGAQASDPGLLSLTRLVVLTEVLPGLAVLPLFTYRFSLVGHEENARYSRTLFIFTTAALLAGAVASALWKHPLGMAAAVAAALVFRATLAFTMGSSIVPGLTAARLLLPLIAGTALCLAIGSVTRLIQTNGAVGPFDDTHLRAVAYLMVCAMLFLFRHRMRPLWGLRLPADASASKAS